jgi:hypothetical protein
MSKRIDKATRKEEEKKEKKGKYKKSESNLNLLGDNLSNSNLMKAGIDYCRKQKRSRLPSC